MAVNDESQTTKILGAVVKAEAAAIAARGKALRDSPDLVSLTQAERWNGVLPTQMIPSGSLPIIGVGK